MLAPPAGRAARQSIHGMHPRQHCIPRGRAADGARGIWCSAARQVTQKQGRQEGDAPLDGGHPVRQTLVSKNPRRASLGSATHPPVANELGTCA